MTADAPEKLLIFAAEAKDDYPPLNLNNEIRRIQNALRHSRKHFDVRPEVNAGPAEVRQALLDFTPSYLHFCGHGTGQRGIVLQEQIVTADALADLLKWFEGHIKCVVLNACYSDVQAQAIVQHVDYVVGMNDRIGDDAAIQFAEGFYDALGAGKPIPIAFGLGCNAIRMAELGEHHIPQMLTRPGLISTGTAVPGTQVFSFRRDWDGAPEVKLLCGRQQAAEQLRSWILDESCRVVLITGLGGIGKTDLVTGLGRGGVRSSDTPALADGIQGHFDVVVWRSLLNALLPDDLFADILGVISDHEQSQETSSEKRLSEILRYLQDRRCLLILDNIEAVLQPADPTMRFRDGYELYGSFFELVGKTAHQSCLLLTSREKPKTIANLEGERKAVRSLALTGLGGADAQTVFAEIGPFTGSDDQWQQVARQYAGNPLALELVARHVQQVFHGNLSAFLKGSRSVFADLEEVLDWHLDRVTDTEMELINWLAIEREPVSIETLEQDLLSSRSRDRLTSTLQSLQRRIPLEHVAPRYVTLQPVLIEHVTARLVERLSGAFETAVREMLKRRSRDAENPTRALELLAALNTHSLVKATAKENVREAQQRLIMDPIAERVTNSCDRRELRPFLASLLDIWRRENANEPGYATGNIINLLSRLNIDLHGMSFSGLRVWQASLHDVNLHNTDFSFAAFRNTTFRHAFGSAFSLSYTPDGRFIAVGDDNGEVRLFSAAGGELYMRCAGHADVVSAVTFSMDGEMMASASYDNTIRLWNMKDGRCTNFLLGHKGWVYSVAFSPDGQLLASASEDGTCRVWDLRHGTSVIAATHEQPFLADVAFSPDGRLLAAAGSSGVIDLFPVSDLNAPTRLVGHTGRIRSLAFSRQGDMLASGAEDRRIFLWNPEDGSHLATLAGHTGTVMSLSFSAAGDVLASGSDDHTVRLWSTGRKECIGQLYASPSRIWAVACSPTAPTLATASEDSAIRIWNTDTRQRLTTLRGYSNKVWSLSFCPDGSRLAAGNEDSFVRIWDVREGRTSLELQGHASRIWATACSPDGNWIASASDDLTVRIWDARTGACRHVIRGHDDWIRSLTFSPDSRLIASAAEDGRILVCDAMTGGLRTNINAQIPRVFAVTFCGDAERVAAGGADQDVHLFSVRDGSHLAALHGHSGWVSDVVAFGTSILASGSEDGSIRAWNLTSGASIDELRIGYKVWCTAFCDGGASVLSGAEDGTLRRWRIGARSNATELRAHQGSLWSLAVNAAQNTVATAGDDGVIRLWQLPDLAPCAGPNTLRSPRPYEAMNISGALGLSDEQRNALTALGAIEFPGR